MVYVGRIDEGITKSDLRKRFEIFGPVEDISVHFREHGYVSSLIFTLHYFFLNYIILILQFLQFLQSAILF